MHFFSLHFPMQTNEKWCHILCTIAQFLGLCRAAQWKRIYYVQQRSESGTIRILPCTFLPFSFVYYTGEAKWCRCNGGDAQALTKYTTDSGSKYAQTVALKHRHANDVFSILFIFFCSMCRHKKKWQWIMSLYQEHTIEYCVHQISFCRPCTLHRSASYPRRTNGYIHLFTIPHSGAQNATLTLSSIMQCQWVKLLLLSKHSKLKMFGAENRQSANL